MRLGVYGGSFNPPHLGHLNAAVSVARQLSFDRLLIIPAGMPPHKALSADSPSKEQRAVMAGLMAEEIALRTGIPAEVSRIELERAGKSYTVDTVRELNVQYPDAELWLLMGADMFLSFQDWREPETILSRAGIAAFDRCEGDSEELLAEQRKRLLHRFPQARIQTMLLPDRVDISSTVLREALGEQCLTPQIYGYILRERLYGTNLDLRRLTLRQLRPVALSYLRAGRVRHVLGVEEEAIRLAEQYGADVQRARIAALLHDCTKKLTPEEHFALCEQYGVELDELERSSEKLLHAKTGAALARHVFGADDMVYGAIRWHTTGRAHMTLLEKVIYLADYIEPNRKFEGVDELREAVRNDLDEGLKLGLRMSIEELEERGSPVHYHTREAYDFLRGR